MPVTNTPAAAPDTKSTGAPAPVKAVAKAAAPVAKKPAVKVSAKAATKSVPSVKTPASNKVAAKKVLVAKTTPAEKPVKIKKVKMVRDSFTFPKPEFAVLEDLKLRAAKLTTPIKKTELIRAGIKALASMGDANFLAAIRSVPNLKTGRPTKD